MEKGRKNGIIRWKPIDGLLQVSDAVVDWYGVKKLAYSYIGRSQQPFCMITRGSADDGRTYEEYRECTTRAGFYSEFDGFSE